MHNFGNLKYRCILSVSVAGNFIQKADVTGTVERALERHPAQSLPLDKGGSNLSPESGKMVQTLKHHPLRNMMLKEGAVPPPLLSLLISSYPV